MHFYLLFFNQKSNKAKVPDKNYVSGDPLDLQALALVPEGRIESNQPARRHRQWARRATFLLFLVIFSVNAGTTKT